MQKHENRDREPRYDNETDWGLPPSRHGHSKLRRVRHAPYKREPAGRRSAWFDQDDETY